MHITELLGFEMKRFINVILFLQIYHIAKSEDKTVDKINVAVFPEYIHLVDNATALGHPSVQLMTFSLDNPVSDYDKILRGKAFLEENNIQAIIGHWDEDIVTVIDAVHIPYLCISPVESEGRGQVFELHPSIADFSRAINVLSRKYPVDKLALLYDGIEGLHIIQQFMDDNYIELKTWLIDEDDNDDDIRLDLIGIRTSRVQRCVIVCRFENVITIFKKASELAMLTSPYEWYLYDPGYDLHGIILQNAEGLVVNFTSFSIFQPSDDHSREKDKLIKGLMSDAILTLEHAMDMFDPVIDYNGEFNTSQLITNVQQTDTNGMSGHIQFDENKRRIHYDIHITGYNGRDTFQIGHWNSTNKTVELKDVNAYWDIPVPFPLNGKEISVVMIVEEPFTMIKAQNLTGNDRFEGYTVDLLLEISKLLNFTYNIHLVYDGKFGSQSETGEWNGIIAELLVGNATLSVASMIINAAREEAVDFTKPFMNQYVNVLLKLPVHEQSFFAFLYPLHFNVYACIMTSCVFISVCMFCVEKYSIEKKKADLKEALWFGLGSLLKGGTDAFPGTIGGRILACTWWFVILIMVSSYTANLAAFLTVKNFNEPVQSISDLASQSKIKYGSVRSSAILSFFETTQTETFAKMASQMLDVDPDSLVESSEEGYARVMEGNYAFFWDETVNKYVSYKHCDLTELGPRFAPRGLGIGVPPGATYLDGLSMAILKLSDTGKLNSLKKKWFEKNLCDDTLLEEDEENPLRLRMHNVAGLFMVLLGGVILAVLTSAVQFFYNKFIQNPARKQQDENLSRF